MFDSFFDGGGTTRHGFHVLNYDSRWSFRIETGNSNTVDFYTNNFEVNKWYHYVFQYDGTKRIIYENGVKTAENTRALSLNTQERFTIGAKFDGSSPSTVLRLPLLQPRINTRRNQKDSKHSRIISDEVITMPMSTVNPTNLITKSKIYPSLSNGVVNNGVTTSVKLPQNMVRQPFVYKDSQQPLK